MKLPSLPALCGFLCALTLCAADAPPRLAELRKLSDGLRPKAGEIELSGGVAKISLSKDFRYLDPKDTETVVSSIWGNPRGGKSLGMIIPSGFDPLSSSWAVIISYSQDGYIKDNDAQSLDYNKMMEQMKEGTREANKEREKQGYPAMELVGWAEPPRYDPATHKMYWAKKLKFADSPGETLNYNIRILGRRGVMVLNAVAPMAGLAAVRNATPSILAMVNFQEGSRYVDFNSSTDKIATYGLAALVAGGIAAKAGLFKLILVGLLAAKKFVIVAAIAVAGYDP